VTIPWKVAADVNKRGFRAWLWFLGAFLQVTGQAGEWLVDGQVRIGGDGRGALSGGLSNYPLGAAYVYATQEERANRSPDLFVAAGRFSREPGLFLYRWVGTSADGAPVFGDRVEIAQPGEGKVPPTGTIFQTRSGVIYGFWLIKQAIVRTRFDRAAKQFVRLPLPPVKFDGPEGAMNPDNRAPGRFTVLENPDGSLEIVMSVSDGTAFRPANPPGHRDPAYRPFDGRGIWRGGWPYVYLRGGRLASPEVSIGTLNEVRDLSATRREALLSHGGLTFLNLDEGGRERELITGSHFGNFYCYATRSEPGQIRLEAYQLLRDADGRVLRSPIISASPIAYGKGMIVGGEGALFYLKFERREDSGALRFAGPLEVLEERALLYAGSLPVVNSVDWNGDGATDLVVGNSEGRILWFQNRGSSAAPEFARGLPLRAGGEPIHTQQGYWGIQGPGEARWGYISPCVVDWNGDGAPDLVSSDATARHSVYLNNGDARSPRLDGAKPLYCDGLDVHGTWRVRPAAGRIGARMAYVALDDDDQFHLYWRIDDQNLRDAGKLRLEDGTAIAANFLSAGGTGRSKITLHDWDADGAVDLLVGTPRHGSIPNPKTGLPQSKGLPGSAVLWLRNTGTNEAPRYAFPLLLHVRGKPLYLGQHECSVAVTNLGGGGPNLVIGDEEGRVHFISRHDVTWAH
jgi:hypothetical protein